MQTQPRPCVLLGKPEITPVFGFNLQAIGKTAGEQRECDDSIRCGEDVDRLTIGNIESAVGKRRG